MAGLLQIDTVEVPYATVHPLLTRANTWAGAILQRNPAAYFFDEQLDDGTAGGGWDFDIATWRPA